MARYVRGADGREYWHDSTSGRGVDPNVERAMTAKFAGTCRVCGGRFEVGCGIVWAKALGARHQGVCPTIEVAAKADRLADAADALLAERDAWLAEDAADALLNEYAAIRAATAATRRAANIGRLEVGIYRVEFSGRRNTDPINLRISADKKNPGSFYFKRKESDEGIGRIWADGRIQLWQNDLSADERARAQEALEILLGSERLGAFGEAYAREAGSCFRCGRTLTDEDSIDRGLGSYCATQVEGGY
jgi:hypothetical protein